MSVERLTGERTRTYSNWVKPQESISPVKTTTKLPPVQGSQVRVSGSVLDSQTSKNYLIRLNN